MRMEKKKLKDLKPAGYNPRKDLQPGDAEYEKLKASIERWDYIEPIVWNEQTGHIVSGHQRVKVLAEKGVKATEVSVVDLSEAEERALNLALNKVRGDWDYPKLSEVLSGMDLSLREFTGFNADEVAIIVKGDSLDLSIPTVMGGDGAVSTENFVVHLVFETFESASAWCSENGHASAMKEGKRSAVVDMDVHAD